jgi:hypothetical protein
MVRIHDTATNEVIDREMNDQEFEVYEAEQAAVIAEQTAANKAREDKEAAQSKLAALGLTTDDLKALGL